MVILDAPRSSGDGEHFDKPPKAVLGPAPKCSPQPPQVINCKMERMNVSGPFLFGNLDAITLSARYPKQLGVVMQMQEYMGLRKRFNAKVKEIFHNFVDHSPDRATVTAIEIPIYAAIGLRREYLMRKAYKEFLQFVRSLNEDFKSRNIRILVRDNVSAEAPWLVMRQLFLEAPVPIV